ncbi:hypothetical protein PHLGIDRAFT_16513 [Phlebiopsis gigantea 11061_1 CR5-6]|uniref:Uncharacterized protein n=1 Tax=Phlebiopsis gigantea (strain 11061_1 CR5-6) TaxID=745531 RepID=A0A0C3RR66_PHLG1|nr:hypothetical protein PHLGIDRAFT_16513 [Phlebiopsis gigantea 11061_1 CR5-6]
MSTQQPPCYHFFVPYLASNVSVNFNLPPLSSWGDQSQGNSGEVCRGLNVQGCNGKPPDQRPLYVYSVFPNTISAIEYYPVGATVVLWQYQDHSLTRTSKLRDTDHYISWFKASGTVPLHYPPLLPEDCEPVTGDLFLFCNLVVEGSGRYRMWQWEDHQGRCGWYSLKIGCKRTFDRHGRDQSLKQWLAIGVTTAMDGKMRQVRMLGVEFQHYCEQAVHNPSERHPEHKAVPQTSGGSPLVCGGDQLLRVPHREELFDRRGRVTNPPSLAL